MTSPDVLRSMAAHPSSQVVIRPTFRSDNDETHVVCCRSHGNVGLCGADLSDTPWTDDPDYDEPASCVVCEDLDTCMGDTCPLTGRSCS